MNVADNDCQSAPQADLPFSLADRWIWAKLQETIIETTRHINEYRFDLAVQTLYEFTWNHYCDWYLELSKALLTTDQPEAVRHATRFTLINVLENLLRLLHPFIPFMTETLWQQVYPLSSAANRQPSQSIMNQPYPASDPAFSDKSIIADMVWVQDVIVAIRTIRSEMNINPGKWVPVLIRHASTTDKQRFTQAALLIVTLAKISSVEWLAPKQAVPAAATALMGEMEMFIPLAGLIDLGAETARLNKEIAKLQAEILKCENKLNNPGFVDKAPAAVVAQEKSRIAEFTLAMGQLQQQLEKLGV